MNRTRLCGLLVAATFSLLAGVALADDEANKLEATVEIPQLNIGRYHRPYVAVWIANSKDEMVQNVAVWYQLKGRGGKGGGTKWLPDLRQWWRDGGRNSQMPIDGISGATRPAGKHELAVDDQDALTKLKPGKYSLVVEAAREHGGRELVVVPFVWPAKEEKSYSSKGTNELGEITLTVRP
ncbi:DUF2271 domain-containing protein [Blastopirellula sp. JC732]|uniref:DUF2271 domain-containing protein n=1 Tax=Blastopirellula sediminis TaxID=2894196 RepID=A0A9X1SIT1_9BACT|nr:DUF2271 domain-containing protein [Blastopirellula sediminis]MCC9604753.1 DUF2271 domain-containing protein [Blastopirellula sediminis]MCC9631948.1 DUF2271 domain-containing protein [Blastopirellula sediminis]